MKKKYRVTILTKGGLVEIIIIEGDNLKLKEAELLETLGTFITISTKEII